MKSTTLLALAAAAVGGYVLFGKKLLGGGAEPAPSGGGGGGGDSGGGGSDPGNLGGGQTPGSVVNDAADQGFVVQTGVAYSIILQSTDDPSAIASQLEGIGWDFSGPSGLLPAPETVDQNNLVNAWDASAVWTGASTTLAPQQGSLKLFRVVPFQ